jgi:hypothetical protein
MRSIVTRGVLAFICGLLIADLAYGQVEISGRIAGIVTDSTGARIPGVEVTVSGPTLFAPKSVITGEDASYFVDKLPLGNYKVNFTFPGFKTVEQNNVNIRANFTATINVTMEVGALEETALVVESAPVVDVTTATQATTFDTGLLKEIPTGRDTWSTLATVPGLTPSKFDVGGTESFQQTGTSVHGSSGQTAYNVNGLNLNWPGGSGSATAFYFDNDGFEEVQVVTDAAQAETLVGGVQINMISKQGTNEIRGQMVGYYTTSKLASNPNYPTFNGRPVEAGTKLTMMRDTNVQMGFPIVRDRLWWFSGYRRYDINLAVPAVKRPDGSAIKDNNHQSTLNARLDIAITDRQRLSLNWLYNSINRFYRGSTGLTDDVATGRQIEPAWVGQAQWTYTPTNNLVLESRFGNMTLHFSQSYQPEVKPGTIAVSDTVLGTVKYARPGGSTLNHTYHARGTQNVSYFAPRLMGGKHNFRGGFEYAQLSNGNRVFVYRDLTITLANGQPLRANLLNTPRRSRERVNETAAFIQDSAVFGRLTLNMGLRYDRFLTFLPPQRSEAGTWVGERNYPRSANIATFIDLSPRISAAFDVNGNGRSVIRASFSRFVDLEGSSLASQLNPNAGSTVEVAITALGPDNYPLDDLRNAKPTFVEGGQFRTADPNLKRGFSRQITAGYERQILGDVRASVGYYFRSSHNYRMTFNRALSLSDYTPLTVINSVTNEPMTIWNLNQNKVGINPDDFITNAPQDPDNAYHGLEFNGSKRMSRNWQLLAGFTVQRREGDSVEDPTNPNANLYREGNLLGSDSTYVAKLSGTYTTPFGVTVSANYQHYTGYPEQATQLFRNGQDATGATVALRQNSVTVPLQTRGDERLPSVDTLNMRFGYQKPITERYRIQPSLDLYNVFNTNTVTGRTKAIGPNFNRPLTIISQRFVKFGLRIEF